jgi:hypothetical protein
MGDTKDSDTHRGQSGENDTQQLDHRGNSCATSYSRRNAAFDAPGTESSVTVFSHQPPKPKIHAAWAWIVKVTAKK